MFTTSDICLALLEEPSTLKTSIGWEIVQVLIPLEWTKSQSIKLSVVLQSKRALIEWTLLVLVILIFTKRTKNIPCTLRILAESCLDSHFFYFSLWEGILMTGAKKEVDISFDSLLLALTFSISSTVNLFTESFQDISFTSCFMQNSLPRGALFSLQWLYP